MKQKVALVLGSGGARGLSHIGVIKALNENKYEISSIAGSSIGALIGGVYACGKLHEFEEWVSKLNKMSVFKKMDFTISKSGIIKAEKAFKELQNFIPDRNIEDLPIPLTIVATDVKNKKERVISSGSLWEAIRASISIPMVITPARIADMQLVDGGVINPVPANRVERQNDDILMAVDVNTTTEIFQLRDIEKSEILEETRHTDYIQVLLSQLNQIIPFKKSEGKGYFGLINDTSNMMLSQISKLTLELSQPDIVIDIPRSSCGTFDFHKSERQIAHGSQETQNKLHEFELKKAQNEESFSHSLFL